MTRPRILVFAYSDVGHACLKALLDRKENVVAVYTHEDRVGENIWFPSVAELAKSKGIPVLTAQKISDTFSPDLIFSFYYRNLIPLEVLSQARLGAFNMHGSFLPRYRGRAPINWAVLNGETVTGATLHEMVAKPDAGDIVDQEAVAIGPDDTAADVQAGVTAAATLVLARQVENLKAGAAPRIPQDQARASYFGGRRPEDGEINWSLPAQHIHNLVRAVSHPYPGAFGQLMGEKTWIWKTRLSDRAPADKKVGAVSLGTDGLFVTCGDGRVLEILSLQRNGGEMTAWEFGQRCASVPQEGA